MYSCPCSDRIGVSIGPPEPGRWHAAQGGILRLGSPSSTRRTIAGGNSERRRIWIALGLSRVIGGDIGKRGLVQRLGDIRHQLIGPAAASIVIELLVDRRT